MTTIRVSTSDSNAISNEPDALADGTRDFSRSIRKTFLKRI